ncbi:hypothetical protein BEP19_09560 [Ammoniphilus oxalaticus]|uniref:DUF1036 domain-containing protein n=1 Tax=Ammoniphilus oxalaticus TaxID=66863 RepID=A0A419SKS5_9BACL|nr:DUF1036 domain-containing protein [Ammoniphilus oxalaticus]RKD24611.1 hypothetical protein BEP19_09560 [Ammoniphilus oxalaticus]
MGLYFQNSTNRTVYVTYGYPNRGCGPVNYAKIGWYAIAPGQRRLLWSGYAGGNTFYYYAEDGVGRTWSGVYFTDVSNQAFHWCWDTRCASCRSVGMRPVSVPFFYSDYTVNLISSSSQRRSKAGNIRYVLPSAKGVRVQAKKIPLLAKKRRGKGKPVSVRRVSLPKRTVRKK